MVPTRSLEISTVDAIKMSHFNKYQTTQKEGWDSFPRAAVDWRRAEFHATLSAIIPGGYLDHAT